MMTISANSPREMPGLPAIPEPWTVRDTLLFSVTGLTIFIALFAFMFSLSNM